jgi:hypothetical protein
MLIARKSIAAEAAATESTTALPPFFAPSLFIDGVPASTNSN